jgi:hypothetical protein
MTSKRMTSKSNHEPVRLLLVDDRTLLKELVYAADRSWFVMQLRPGSTPDSYVISTIY